MFRWIILLKQLTKLRISIFAALSACAGFILAHGGISPEMVMPAVGILILACGSCAFNQYQEREIDGLMQRTRGRPLPAGKMRPAHALLTSFILIASGLAVLLATSRGSACWLGIFAVLWYNGVYFYLKRKTAWAILPGALIGAVPPAMGWVSGEGNLLDPRLMALCLFFFIWQVPHFWLLLFLHGGDYGDAGLPTLTAVFNHRQLARLTSVWMVAAAGTSLLLPLFGVVTNPFIRLVLAGAGVWLGLVALRLSRGSADLTTFRRAFGWINLFALLVMVLLVGDALLAGGEPASFTRFRRETRETAAEAGIPDSFGCRGQERSGERGAVLYRTATSLRASTPAAGAVSLVARKGHASQQKFW